LVGKRYKVKQITKVMDNTLYKTKIID